MLQQNSEPINNQIAFFVIYSISQGRVTQVFESSSQELLALYHETDAFRGNALNDREFLSTTVVFFNHI